MRIGCNQTKVIFTEIPGSVTFSGEIGAIPNEFCDIFRLDKTTKPIVCINRTKNIKTMKFKQLW